jgi:hypothetical protein
MKLLAPLAKNVGRTQIGSVGWRVELRGWSLEGRGWRMRALDATVVLYDGLVVQRPTV